MKPLFIQKMEEEMGHSVEEEAAQLDKLFTKVGKFAEKFMLSSDEEQEELLHKFINMIVKE